MGVCLRLSGACMHSIYAPPDTREVHLCTGTGCVHSGTASFDEHDYDGCMAIDRSDREARQIRLDAIIERFRAERRRRLVEIGKALWNRTERAKGRRRRVAGRPPTVN